ncbi:MAG: hypothetical protein HY815_00170 [Candidatus Riflebacteria bacterium]|nr:hypothetical protein [Candidatus Riflebacteria bacterium]
MKGRVRELIRAGESGGAIEREAVAAGFTPLSRRAAELIESGATTLEFVRRALAGGDGAC